jgi:type I restriction-modification system DNA methylase subunit
MSQEEAKLKIHDLIEKYEVVKATGKIAHFSEEDTKTNFIMPLFGALGWDLHDREEVTAEEQISGQRVDYGFYHNGHIKFYLEAKPLKADLHREEFAKQSMRYSWNKGVTWAILTDFESVIVFNALSPEKVLHGKKYFEIPYTEYLERFDQLWLLSKEAFSKNLLDQEAEKHGKKLQKISVTENLSKDLNECRELLTNAFQICNQNVPSDFIDEGVQKLLDRLIFIRVAEDRGIEPPTLRPLINQWIANGKQASPYISMVEKFRELDAIYNSNLFSEHPFEKWEEFAGATEKVVDILYGKKSYFDYDFSVIPADVLGSVYENYLGYKMQKAPKKTTLFGEVAELGKDARKRKEHGIYYTPKFIVHYIAEHALGPVLDRCRSVADLQKIKVLDPACGSGSFLVAALELILKKYASFGYKPDGLVKMQILENNIYGVDLDQQAVELARLNLLLQTFDGKVKLLNLGKNIKNGNSLISGTDKELRKFFGKNFRDRKPFNWEDEFPEVFKQGGFDVVIGNPPYVGVRELDGISKKYFEEKFQTAKEQYDLYVLFMEQSLMELLKQCGFLGFIVPNKFMVTKYGAELRRLIIENSKLVSFQDYSKDNVFPDASVYPVVAVLEKTAEKGVIVTEDDILSHFGYSKENKITSKIETAGEFISFDAWRPLAASGDVKGGNNILISNREIERYFLSKDILGSLEKFRDRDVQPGKIIMKKICFGLEAGFDDSGCHPINTTYCVKGESVFDTKYILGLLNSKLMTYYAREKYAKTALRGGFIELRVFQVKQLPLIETLKTKKDELVVSVDKMLMLKSATTGFVENSEKWLKVKDEIRIIDQKINQEVYRLYDLTEEEIGIVESATK